MKVLFACIFLAVVSSAVQADEITCKYDQRMVESPADSRLAGHNRFHPGIRIRCIGGPAINIANEKLAKKFDDELNGRAPGTEARMKGVITANVKKHGGNLLEVTSYKFLDDAAKTKQ
jgi:hypothetical protein